MEADLGYPYFVIHLPSVDKPINRYTLVKDHARAQVHKTVIWLQYVLFSAIIMQINNVTYRKVEFRTLWYSRQF